MLPLAFSTYFGVERPFYQLAHNLVLASPFGRILRRYGTMAASHRHAREGARVRSGGARLPGRRLGGPPPDLGGQHASTSPAARASSAWRSTPTCRSSRWSRSAARRRRSSSAAGAWLAKLTGVDKRAAAQGAADLARAALGAERRRPARPHPPAGEDHDRGPAADRPARGVRPRAGRRRGLRPRHRRDAGRRSTGSRPSGASR